jgi:hypothetical protein
MPIYYVEGYPENYRSNCATPPSALVERKGSFPELSIEAELEYQGNLAGSGQREEKIRRKKIRSRFTAISGCVSPPYSPD